MIDALLTTSQAAAYLGITPTALRSLVARGSIVPDKRSIGAFHGGKGVHKFRVATLEAFKRVSPRVGVSKVDEDQARP
jgi:hypothetical protein